MALWIPFPQLLPLSQTIYANVSRGHPGLKKANGKELNARLRQLFFDSMNQYTG